MVINTNLYAIASASNLNKSQSALGRALSRLSSGDKIQNPSDDAAGLAVSEKLKAQQGRVNAASNNVQSAISYVQTTDGFLSNIASILSRLSELTTQAKDVTKNSQDIALYNQEFVSLKNQLQQTIGGSVYGITGTPLGTFNGISLFGNTTALTVTIGEDNSQTLSIPGINLRDTSVSANPIYALLSIATGLNVSDSNAGATVTSAIQQLATVRASLGATQSRLQVVASQLGVQEQNIASSISTIRDVDVAEESTQYARYQILVQAGTSMLSQANTLPSSVLRLLQQ